MDQSLVSAAAAAAAAAAVAVAAVTMPVDVAAPLASEGDAARAAAPVVAAMEVVDEADLFELPSSITTPCTTVSTAPCDGAAWTACWQGSARCRSVVRALDFIFQLSLDPDNFALFGADIVQCFNDIAKITPDPVRRRAQMFGQQAATRLQQLLTIRGWKRRPRPTPLEVLEGCAAAYCLQRLGIEPPHKRELLAFCRQRKSYTPRDYFGYDPRRQAPVDDSPELCTRCGNDNLRGLSVCSHCQNPLALLSRYRCLSNSLIYMFYANRAGAKLGADYKDALKWLDSFRPYKSHRELPMDAFLDQCYLITHVLFTLNNWGELRIDPNLLAHEYCFVRQYLDFMIHRRDVHLVGEFLEALTALGATEDDPLIRRGMTFLLRSQLPDGSWDSHAGRDPYTMYHATMVGAQGLLLHHHCGFGPNTAGATEVLRQWAAAEVEAIRAFAQRSQREASV